MKKWGIDSLMIVSFFLLPFYQVTGTVGIITHRQSYAGYSLLTDPIAWLFLFAPIGHIWLSSFSNIKKIRLLPLLFGGGIWLYFTHELRIETIGQQESWLNLESHLHIGGWLYLLLLIIEISQEILRKRSI